MPTPIELHVYDFDGTLFRSPEQPVGWAKNNNWWGHQDSLGRPCVPDKPDGSWWVGSVVSKAKESTAQHDVVAVLATGRQDNSFARWRVPELLGQVGLNFDQVYLHPNNGMPTDMFKEWVVTSLLRRYPEITVVRTWDDTKANLDSMGAVVGDRVYYPTLIRSTPKEVICTPGSPDDVEPDHMKVAGRWR